MVLRGEEGESAVIVLLAHLKSTCLRNEFYTSRFVGPTLDSPAM